MHVSQNLSPEGQIHNLQDLLANRQNLCNVFGTYVWIDPRQEIEEGSTEKENPPPNCHAAIRLVDGTIIHLQPTWHEDAVRKFEELREYRNKPIVASGLVYPEGPPPPSNIAYMKGPSFFGPVSITDRNTWNIMHGGKLEWK